MLGLVARAGPVALLAPDDAVAVHEQRAERVVAGLERLAGQVDAAPQVAQVVGGEAHGRTSTSAYAAPPARRA